MRKVEVRTYATQGDPVTDLTEGSTLTFDDGALIVLDSNGGDVAIYAPGAWISGRFLPEQPVIVNTPEPGDPVRPA